MNPETTQPPPVLGAPSTASHTLRDLLLYFLRLGTLGFGGPIALAGHMQKDLVEERRWVSKQDYLEGLAFSQLSPGPLAAQLAMYLGWLRAGTTGATLVGIAFILPSFLMVLVLAALYVHFGSLPWIQGMFYGIGAAVIAIIVRSAIKLVRGTVGRDWLLWAIFTALAITTAWTKAEIVWLFLLCGVIAMFVKAPPLIPSRATSAMFVGGVGPLLTGIHGLASIATVGVLFLFFLKAGAFVFGSGLAIVPFLYGGVVAKFHWLTERQFVDAVAVAMITPGPVVITAAFIGYVVAGPVGAGCSVGSFCSALFHCSVRRTLLPPLRSEPAGQGLCSRRYRGSRGRYRRSCIYPGPAISSRSPNCPHRVRHTGDPNVHEEDP